MIISENTAAIKHVLLYITGNYFLHSFTSQNQYKLRIDLTDHSNNHRYAEYDIFSVANETSKFELTIGGYHGTAGELVNTVYSRSFFQ